MLKHHRLEAFPKPMSNHFDLQKHIELHMFEDVDLISWIARAKKIFELQNVPKDKKQLKDLILNEDKEDIGMVDFEVSDLVNPLE
ncbi:unnamed protein product [Dovyalis caffra]|uniref:Uncharacterized protein n=1 Tax=Dovyalis caffra TaxID=77055 RepID=A0AAV1R2C3_9ROSI|nr:unnamed protein product [Dovyalis caffra]